MRFPIENLQAGLQAEHAPSALKLWLQLFAESEPTHFETDSNGDTIARGPVDDFWIEIRRTDSSVHMYATMHERLSAYDPVVFIPDDRWEEIYLRMGLMLAAIGRSLEVERASGTIIAGKSFVKMSEATTAYRALGEPYAALPQGAVEARYNFAINLRNKNLEDIYFRSFLEYRAGRRAVADNDASFMTSDGTNVKWQPHLGSVIIVKSNRQTDEALDQPKLLLVYKSIGELLQTAWDSGIGAYS